VEESSLHKGPSHLTLAQTCTPPVWPMSFTASFRVSLSNCLQLLCTDLPNFKQCPPLISIKVRALLSSGLDRAKIIVSVSSPSRDFYFHLPNIISTLNIAFNARNRNIKCFSASSPLHLQGLEQADFCVCCSKFNAMSLRNKVLR
jgi:hypothetical protein